MFWNEVRRFCGGLLFGFCAFLLALGVCDLFEVHTHPEYLMLGIVLVVTAAIGIVIAIAIGVANMKRL
jgi:hypothetical protein